MGQLLFDCRLIFQVLVFRCISWAGGLALKVESSQSNPLIEFPKTYPKLWTQLSGVKDMVDFSILSSSQSLSCSSLSSTFSPLKHYLPSILSQFSCLPGVPAVTKLWCHCHRHQGDNDDLLSFFFFSNATSWPGDDDERRCVNLVWCAAQSTEPRWE